MRVNYNVGIDDMVAFNRYHIRNSRSMQFWYRVGYLWGVFIGVAIALAFSSWDVWPRVALVAGFAVIYGIIYRLNYYRWIDSGARKMIAEGKNKGILGDHTMTLSKDGLIETCDVGESRSTWGGVERIEEDDEYVYLYIGAYQAHVIPRRAFTSGADATEFIKVARAYHTGSSV